MRAPETVSRWQWLRAHPLFWPVAGLLVLVAVNVALNPGFLRIVVREGHLYGLPIDILNEGARGMLLALGMTLVIATGGIDLSVGSVMAIAGAVAAVLITQVTASLPVVLAGALGVAMLAGLVNGVLVAWAGVQPIVATLILMVAGRGLALLIAGGRTITFRAPAFEYLGKGYLFGVPFAAVLAVAFYLATHAAVRRTSAAWFIEAVGDNETASRFAGLASARVKCLVYVFAGLCAGLAGVLATANIGTADSYRTGEYMELDAIFAVVVGGTPLLGGRFSLAGSLIGALLLQTLTTTMYSVGVPPAIAPIPKAVVVVGVCLLQSAQFRARVARCFRRRAAA